MRWSPNVLLLIVALLSAGVVTPAGWHHDPARLTLSIATARGIDEAADDRSRPQPYETSVRDIAEVFRELGLPLPRRITLSLYESPQVFERALISSGGLSPALARAVRDFAVGVAFADRLLVLERESRRGRRAWLRLLAHEMAHLSQIELAGGEGRGAQWLSEGMAEWIAFTVLDELRVARMSVERNTMTIHASALLDANGFRLDLAQLGDSPGFLDRSRREGAGPIYRLAFLLADHLIERHGLGALIEYFRAFAFRDDARRNFEQAFGQRVEDFQREVIAAAAERRRGEGPR